MLATGLVLSRSTISGTAIIRLPLHEIKALLAHPTISPGLDEDLLAEYLAFGYLSGSRTLFPGICKLMPGHHLRLRLDNGGATLNIARYWDVPEPQPQERSDAEWIRDCRDRLEETVRLRLMSDVPLGMFLSGGVDSERHRRPDEAHGFIAC